MALRMTHPRYGTRTVKDEQRAAYVRTGWSEVGEAVPTVVDASRDQILADVGDDPIKAREALEAEQSRSKPRSTLVAALLRVIESADQTSEV